MLAQQQPATGSAISEPPKPPGRVIRENVADVRTGVISDYRASNVDFSEIDQESKDAYRQMVFDLHAGKTIDKKERRLILFESGKRIGDLEADLQLLSEVEDASKIPARISELQRIHDANDAPRMQAHVALEKAIFDAQRIVNEARTNLNSTQLARTASARELQETKNGFSQIKIQLESDFLLCSSCKNSRTILRQNYNADTVQKCNCGGTFELQSGIRSRATERIRQLQAEFETLGRLIDDTRKPLRSELSTEAEAEEIHLAHCRQSGMTAEEKTIQWKKWKRENPVLKAAGKIINESAQRRAEIVHEIPLIRDGELFDIQNIEFF